MMPSAGSSKGCCPAQWHPISRWGGTGMSYQNPELSKDAKASESCGCGHLHHPSIPKAAKKQNKQQQEQHQKEINYFCHY